MSLGTPLEGFPRTRISVAIRTSLSLLVLGAMSWDNRAYGQDTGDADSDADEAAEEAVPDEVIVTGFVGSLRSDWDAFDLLAAVFPGASITGVPKVRCMQIIDTLKEVRRGALHRSAGWLGLDGGMDFNILIRTFLLQSGRACFHVGGGIAADSDAEREYQETLTKGRALEEALTTLGVTALRSSVQALANTSTQVL